MRRRLVTRVRAACVGALALCATPALPAALHAQASPVQAAAGAGFEAYSFASADDVGLESITLLTMPFALRVPLHRQLELRAGGAYARGTLQRPGSPSADLSGLTDTEVRLTWAAPGDRVRVSAVGVVPTGVTELESQQMQLTGVMAAELMPFAITNWGSGGGIGGSVAAALPLAPGSTLGVSVGYVAAREFEPLADATFAYRPGDQLHVRAAVDRTFGTAGKASLQLSWQKYGSDASAGTNVYQAGDRMHALASYAFPAGARATGVAYAGYQRRQGGSHAAVSAVTPAHDLVWTGAAFRVPAGGVVLTPALDVRVVGRENGVDQGHVITAGTGAEIGMGAAVLVPTLRGRFGRLVVNSGSESAFTGLEVGLVLRTRRVP